MGKRTRGRASNIIITDDTAEADSFAKQRKELSAVEKAKKKEDDDAKKG